MLESIELMRAGDFIEPSEAGAARASIEALTSPLTIGYELEVMPPAIETTPALKALRSVGVPQTNYRQILMDCVENLEELDFKNDAGDALYEVVSPPTNSPLALEVATQGLIRAGLLPKEATEVEITAHASLGIPNQIPQFSTDHYRAIRMLRMVDMLGGSTKNRLINTCEFPEFDASYIWHLRGIAGVSTVIQNRTKWLGDNNRLEFRSLAYLNSTQFGETLERLYFLGTALFGQNKLAQSVYIDLDDWFKKFQRANGLPDASSSSKYVCPETSFKRFGAYIRPYAEFIEKGDVSELRQKTDAIIAWVKEQFVNEALAA